MTGSWRFVVPGPPPAAPLGGGTAPSFSVVIAAYQAEAFVAEAVSSALEQTCPPREVIVVDDGSTDATADVVAGFGDRVVLVRRANGGEGAAKNTGVHVASGDFVVILDADDTFLPRRLEALSALAVERPDLDVLTTDAWLVADGVRTRRVYDESHTFDTAGQRRELLRRNFIFGHAAVRRRRMVDVGGYDETIRVTTDWDLWIRMALSGSGFGLVAEPLATYRMVPTSLSADWVALLSGRLQTLRKTATAPCLSEPERRAVRDAIADHERALTLGEARAAILAGSSGARRRAWTVAADPAQDNRSRVKALLALAWPGLARRLLSRPAAKARAQQATRLGASGGGARPEG